MRDLVPFILSTLFASSIFVSFTSASSKDDCKDIASISDRTRLNSYLRCKSFENPSKIRTTDSKNATEITIVLRAELLNFDETKNNLEFNGAFFAMWMDENLQWNYSLYGNISSMSINSYSVWTPDVAVLSAGNDKTYDHGLGYTRCKLIADGRVMCLEYVHRKIRCETDFKLWPYDRQKCTLIITSWAYSSEQITFQAHEETPDMKRFRSNGEWNYTISRVSYEERTSNYYENVSSPQIAVEFVVDRLHTHLRGRYIGPAIIMMLLTLTTLWLDPKCSERLTIACCNIIIHMMCIKNLHLILPHNGTTVPNLLLFYVYSFVIATVALVLTFFFGRMRDAKMPVPKWIASSTALVFRSKALFGLLDPKSTAELENNSDDTGNLMNDESQKVTWTSVVIVWSWITFICFFCAYIIMYGVLIPSSAGNPPIPALTEKDRVDDQFGHD